MASNMEKGTPEDALPKTTRREPSYAASWLFTRPDNSSAYPRLIGISFPTLARRQPSDFRPALFA